MKQLTSKALLALLVCLGIGTTVAMDHNNNRQALQTAAAAVEDCSICIDAMNSDQPLIHLDCNNGAKGHSFHIDCLHEHVEKGPKTWNAQNKRVSTCPTCRADIHIFDTVLPGRPHPKLVGLYRPLTHDETVKLQQLFNCNLVSISDKAYNPAPQPNPVVVAQRNATLGDLELSPEEQEFLGLVQPAGMAQLEIDPLLVAQMTEEEKQLNGLLPDHVFSEPVKNNRQGLDAEIIAQLSEAERKLNGIGAEQDNTQDDASDADEFELSPQLKAECREFRLRLFNHGINNPIPDGARQVVHAQALELINRIEIYQRTGFDIAQ